MAKDVVVRLQALDGVWEVGGVDRKRGITVENPQPTTDSWGPAGFAFEMRRDPRAIWPDLGAFTPVDVEIAGKLCWSGWISETPSRDAADRVISVQCLGGQSHLDDDVYERAYVHTNVSDWQDARTFPDADLAVWLTAPTVAADNGIATIGFPQGVTVVNATQAGVVLDLGPYSTAASISIDYETSNNSGFFGLTARASGSVLGMTAGPNSDATAGPSISALGAAGTVRGTFAAAYRYVSVFLFYVGSTGAPAADVWIKLKGIRVFTDDAYRSTDASVLKGDTVVKDALSRATIRLNSDRSLIQAASFSIPDLVLAEPKTPREVWAAINAYHDWIAQIDVQKRPVFKPKPTAPTLEVGAWSPLELEDQSANSGEEIYNRVIVVGTQSDGSPLRVERETATSWTAGDVLLDGVTYGDTPGASHSLFGPSTDLATALAHGTFVKGKTYSVTFTVSVASGTSALDLVFGAAFNQTTVRVTVTTTPTTYRLVWHPDRDLSSALGVALSLTEYSGNTVSWSHGYIMLAQPTLIDRRGFRRTKTLPVDAAMTVAAAQTIGDLWLAAHRTTPYKGTFKLTGDQAVRDPATGAYVPLEDLLLRTGELIRDTNAIDPDTGGIGRDGRIASVAYDPQAEEATVTLDNSRASFEALLARFDLLVNAGR